MVDDRLFSAFSAIAADDDSPDRVVADPSLNAKFIEKCRELGLQQSAECLNRSLLNSRKAGNLAGKRKTVRRKRTLHPPATFRIAVEIAVRHLEIDRSASLDQILCNPVLAHEFDQIAAAIIPGFTPFDYRWAALSLRKLKRIRPERSARLLPPQAVEFGKVDEISFQSLPNEQGIYVFVTRTQTLYVGESANLRKRLAKHTDHSDNRELARWFWQNGFGEVFLQLYVLPSATTALQRKAFEQELIQSRNPLFNIQR